MKQLYFLATKLFIVSILLLSLHMIPANAQNQTVSDNEIIIQYSNNLTYSEFVSDFSFPYAKSVSQIIDNYVLITLYSSNDYDTSMNLLKTYKDIIHVQANFLYSDASIPEQEPSFSEQWALYNDGTFKTSTYSGIENVDIHAKEAWDIFKSKRKTIIAILDTGIDYTHPELASSIWVNSKEIPNDGIDNDKNGYIDDINGWNFYSDNNILFNKYSTDDNHGTHCAGTISAAWNDKGIAGIATNPNIKIMPVKCLGGSNSTGTSVSFVRGITYAQRMGAQICNISCGSLNEEDKLLGLKMATSPMLFIVASGNGNNVTGFNIDVSPSYPASYNYSNIITVANVRADGTLHQSSNYGKKSVDIGAPGTSIYSTTVNGGYSYMSGTSMAAPMVTAAAAMLYSSDTRLNLLQVKEIILATANPLPSLKNKVLSGGMLDIAAALSADPVVLIDLDVEGPVINTNVSTIKNSYKKLISLNIIDQNQQGLTVKYALGSQNLEYFKTKGINIKLNSKFQGNIIASSSGKYTIYSKDIYGNTSIKTLNIIIKKPDKL